MSPIGLGLVLLAIAASALPLWLLKRSEAHSARDWLVAPDRMRAQVVRNASVATTMRSAVFVALFAAGASGEVWVVLAMSASLGAGVYLVYLLRRPMLAHLDDALARDGSISAIAFVGRRIGLDVRVRRLAAVLVLVVLMAVVLTEAFVLRWCFEQLLPDASSLARALAAGVVVVAALQAMASGHAAALHVAQFQFGLLYVGLFGSVVVLLYAQASTLLPLGRGDALMLAIGAATCVALVVKRRSRYVDTETIRPPELSHAEPAPFASRVLRRAGKLINQIVSTLVVVAIVVAGMALYGAWSQGLRSSAPSAGGLPGWVVAVLCVVLLLHPVVDLAVWQQLAALRIRAGPTDLPGEEAEQRVRSTLHAHALQSVALGLLMAMLGSLAAAVTGARGTDATLSTIASRLTVLDADLGGTLLPCFVLTLLARALTTMAPQFSAMLCTLRLDLWAGEGLVSWAGVGNLPGEERYRRKTQLAGLALACGVATVSALVPFPGSTLGAAVIVLAVMGCGQLALLLASSHWRKRSSAGDAGTSSGQIR